MGNNRSNGWTWIYENPTPQMKRTQRIYFWWSVLAVLGAFSVLGGIIALAVYMGPK